MYIFFNYIIPQTFFRCTLFDLINIFAPMKLKLPLKLFSFQILPTQHWGRMRKFTPILMVKVFWVRFLQTSFYPLRLKSIYGQNVMKKQKERERLLRISSRLPRKILIESRNFFCKDFCRPEIIGQVNRAEADSLDPFFREIQNLLSYLESHSYIYQDKH